MATYECFTLDVGADGVAVATFEVPGRSMNVITAAVITDLDAMVGEISGNAAIKGLIFTNKKGAFCAGADLSMMQGLANLASGGTLGDTQLKQIYAEAGRISAILRRLETCGKPVVAALNGTTLGGGYEIALACHYRVAADDDKIQIGLPEVKVGLLPGAGGTQRLPRMIGALAALPLILEGKSLNPKAAAKAGLVNAVVPREGLVDAARRWILETPDPVQPWDKPTYKIPGGGPYSDEAHQNFIVGNAMLHKQTYGNYPSARGIMSCVYEGLQVGIDAGLRIEVRYFVQAILSPQARNMIRSLFISMQELNKLARRPKAVPPSQVKKLGMIGAGMMGAGIAYVSAMAGIEVVLIDVSQEGAEKGKAHSADLLQKAVDRGRQTAQGRDAILARIHPTTDFSALKGCDLVIEAVFEDRKVKAETTAKVEAVIGADVVFGSNTSTLPITSLAQASQRQGNFIGIHFFSPVDRMPLVEIILGKETAPATLARAMDYVRLIKKTPIVVNDSRGFYTSRCFSTYCAEGMEMLAEGIAPAIIDNVGRMTGMPRGPLEISDDVALDLAWRIRDAAAKDGSLPAELSPGEKVLKTLAVDLQRFGRKNGKGFYDYPADGKKMLWHGLKDVAPVKVNEAPPALVKELKERLLYRQAVEAARCFEENVITDVRDGDLGAILGWGFAPWTGGPLSLIDTVGAKAFVAACDRLAKQYGPRFAPNTLLREMAEKNQTFYGRFAPRDANAA